MSLFYRNIRIPSRDSRFSHPFPTAPFFRHQMLQIIRFYAANAQLSSSDCFDFSLQNTTLHAMIYVSRTTPGEISAQ